MAALALSRLPPQRERRYPGLIVRQNQPLNLETPLTELGERFTANDKFYVRNHFPMPNVDPQTYKLTVEGHVENRLELSLDDLKRMEAVTARGRTRMRRQ